MNPHNTTPEWESRHRRQEWIIAAMLAAVICGGAWVLYQLGAMFVDYLLDLIFPVTAS